MLVVAMLAMKVPARSVIINAKTTMEKSMGVAVLAIREERSGGREPVLAVGHLIFDILQYELMAWGSTADEDGYVLLSKLLSNFQLQGITEADIWRVGLTKTGRKGPFLDIREASHGHGALIRVSHSCGSKDVVIAYNTGCDAGEDDGTSMRYPTQWELESWGHLPRGSVQICKDDDKAEQPQTSHLAATPVKSRKRNARKHFAHLSSSPLTPASGTDNVPLSPRDAAPPERYAIEEEFDNAFEWSALPDNGIEPPECSSLSDTDPETN